jgi:hypothetical protein
MRRLVADADAKDDSGVSRAAAIMNRALVVPRVGCDQAPTISSAMAKYDS